jgi:hypothetical protein
LLERKGSAMLQRRNTMLEKRNAAPRRKSAMLRKLLDNNSPRNLNMLSESDVLRRQRDTLSMLDRSTPLNPLKCHLTCQRGMIH